MIVAAMVAGCRDAGRSEPDAKADVETKAAPAAKADADTRAGPICRIMASEDGPAAHADATGWLELAAKASFTVRTIETGRELRFEGPGRIRACAGDVALVAEGAAVGLPGSGEAPGAEQWVATACGVARWASGVHRFTGARDACILHSSMGAVHLYLADDVAADEILDGGAPEAGAGRQETPWRRIDARHTFRLHGPGRLDAPSAVKAALGACERAAQSVHGLAARMATPEGGAGNVGELAAESVVARGAARAACGVAAVRVALGGSRPDDQARLDAASARWRAPR